MNKNLHRLVFNTQRGKLMAVAETARSAGKANGSTSGPLLGAALLLTASAIWAPGAMAQVIADPGAPGNQRPQILNTANGTLQVNIQTPSAAGVSRNVYTQFDVNSKGVILNNSNSNVQTQLGGWIQGNGNLAAGSARVILNEINSSNPSQLRGYVEVAGQRADVIIANPSGIVVNGGGFINASGVTLSTGTPQLNPVTGAIDAHRVQGGTVLIEGAGLDTRNADYTAILARATQINASAWAQDLKVVTGANQINAASLAAGSTPSATPIAPASGSTQPAVALDVAAIGGMYAGKIFLIGTEAGLGVTNGGVIGATAGDVVVRADGTLTNTGRIQASGHTNLRSTSGAISNSGVVYAEGSTTLAASTGRRSSCARASPSPPNRLPCSPATSSGCRKRPCGCQTAAPPKRWYLTSTPWSGMVTWHPAAPCWQENRCNWRPQETSSTAAASTAAAW